MKLNLISLALCLIISISTLAQNAPCGFDRMVRTNSNAVQDFESVLLKYNTSSKSRRGNSSGKIYKIPVVVHIIHNGGAENISDAQVLSQIRVLNEDFRKISGTKGDGAGVDTEIEFELAKIDPKGKCTNGIVRIKSELTEHQTYQRSMLKDLSAWDANKYLNMYVVNTINNGILGYASFPGGPIGEDGIVVRDDAFGALGTVTNGNNLGRTTTHEIAHWFGLYHTFQEGCGIDICTDGDKVCDTPPVAAPNFGCPTINSCSNDSPNINDQVANYTDYTNDACKSMFTAGQRDRMQATLNTVRTIIWSNENLIATGTDSNYVAPATCSVVADFTTLNPNICLGSDLNFVSKSLNSPTSYLWTFNGGEPITSTLENPTIAYNTVGSFDVKLKTWNSTSADSFTISNFITVSNPSAGIPFLLYEGFESTSFPPLKISIQNPDTGVTWERTTLAAKTGTASVRINNLINTNYGQSDALVFDAFDLTTFNGTPFMKFNWAYVRSDPSYSDELLVLASKDCGLNWQRIFYRSGNSMTTGPTQASEYIPDSNTVWKNANINLSTFATQQNVIIKIVNVTDGGNCLYIDNIQLGDTAQTASIQPNYNLAKNITIYPNPIKDAFEINSEINLKGKKVIIYNTIGSEVQRIILQNEYNNKVNLINNVPAGMYYLKFENDTSAIPVKLIKN